jgi:hypothetical protein
MRVIVDILVNTLFCCYICDVDLEKNVLKMKVVPRTFP